MIMTKQIFVWYFVLGSVNFLLTELYVCACAFQTTVC